MNEQIKKAIIDFIRDLKIFFPNVETEISEVPYDDTLLVYHNYINHAADDYFIGTLMDLYEKHFFKNDIINVGVAYSSKLRVPSYTHSKTLIINDVSLNITNSGEDKSYSILVKGRAVSSNFNSASFNEILPSGLAIVYDSVASPVDLHGAIVTKFYLGGVA